MAKARERDLANEDDHDRFAKAVMKCEGFTPDCVHHSRCMLGGQCFASPPHLVAARMVESLIPKDGRAGLHLAYLRKVAGMLRSDMIAL